MNNNRNFDSIKQIDGENNEVIYDSNKRKDNNSNKNDSEQNNDADIVKQHATYQDTVNISDPLPLKDSANKSDVFLELKRDSPSMEDSNHSHPRRLHII